LHQNLTVNKKQQAIHHLAADVPAVSHLVASSLLF